MTSRPHETVLINLRAAALRHADEITEADHPVWDAMTQAAIAAVLDAMAEPSEGAIDAGRDVVMSDRMPGAGGRLPKAAVAVSVWSAMLAAIREDAINGH